MQESSSVAVGDIVLISEDRVAREHWPMGRGMQYIWEKMDCFALLLSERKREILEDKSKESTI